MARKQGVPKMLNSIGFVLPNDPVMRFNSVGIYFNIV